MHPLYLDGSAQRFEEIKETLKYKVVVSYYPHLLRQSESIDRHIQLLAEEALFDTPHYTKLEIIRDRITDFEKMIAEEWKEIKERWNGYLSYLNIGLIAIFIYLVIF